MSPAADFASCSCAFQNLIFLIAALFLDYCEGFAHMAHFCKFSGSKPLTQINSALSHTLAIQFTLFHPAIAQFRVIKAFLTVLNICVKLSRGSNYPVS